jgi:hypothetical protein
MISFYGKILSTFKGKNLKNKDGFSLWEKNYPINETNMKKNILFSLWGKIYAC